LVRDMKNGVLPDLIIENSISYNDAYALFDADILLDLSAYVEDDGLYESGEYFNEVLRAGQYQSQQLIMPLSFNMTTIMSSEESLQRYDLDLSKADILDVLDQLTSRANMMQQEEKQHLTSRLRRPSFRERYIYKQVY